MSVYPRFLVVSDLHAFAGDVGIQGDSAINVLDSKATQIFERCAEAIEARFGAVDGILVAGDLTNKADSKALTWVWSQLQALGKRLEAPVIATAGNHDLDSRGLTTPLPNQALMSLSPPFPAGDPTSRAKYFTEHHALVRVGESLVVTLNSSAHHGYTFKGKKELKHGRVLDSAADWLRLSLEAEVDLPKYRILLTHHHPMQLPDFDTEENSVTHGVDKLVRVLSQHGDWLIVHGHKHRGWVYYASGGGDAPTVLSASSFAANLGSGEFSQLVRRQFHVIECHTADGPMGLVHSWNYDGIEWIPAAGGHMLSGVSGFGWKTSVTGLATRLRVEIESRGHMTAPELELFVPEIRYLSFDDRARLLKKLNQGTPSVGHLLSQSGEIVELQKRSNPTEAA